jgi:D-inositol-3-phosphate glycosyltransferase
MRVLMVEHTGRGGMYAYADALCRGLADGGAHVTVLTNSLWPNLPRPYKVQGCLSEFIDKKKQWSQLHWAADRFCRGLANSLRRNRFAIRNCCDIVHLQIGVPLIDQFLLRNLAHHLPVVLTVHDVQPHCDRFNTRRSFLKRYFHIPHRRIVHFQDGKKQLVDNWGLCSDRIDVIPHGIMTLQNPPELTDSRKKLNLPLDRRVVLFFGSIRANKGLDILLKALEIVRLRKPKILLVVAGAVPRGVSFEPYSSMIKRYDLSQHVRTFIQFIAEEEVDYFFAASELVVLPYLKFESQSGVLLRAYAHKKPVVVSDVGAMAELVASDSVGLVVEPGGPEPLAEAIINVLDSLDKFQSCYGPELENKYSWKHIAELTMRSYELAISSRHPS